MAERNREGYSSSLCHRETDTDVWTQTREHRDVLFLLHEPGPTEHMNVQYVCVLVCTHLSAAWKMPLAACALRSGGQEERKRSSSFIMERMLEAETSARERSNARLESWAGETVNDGGKYT